MTQLSKQWKKLRRTELLLKLKSRFSKMILVTNESVRMQSLKLAVFDPDFKLFDGVVIAEEVGLGKPHVEIFDKAFHDFGLRPKDCLMVGDSIENDIIPALKLGCRAILTLEFAKKRDVPFSGQKINSLNALTQSI